MLSIVSSNGINYFPISVFVYALYVSALSAMVAMISDEGNARLDKPNFLVNTYVEKVDLYVCSPVILQPVVLRHSTNSAAAYQDGGDKKWISGTR